MLSNNKREKSLHRQVDMIAQENKNKIHSILKYANILKETKETIIGIDDEYIGAEGRSWLFTENYLKFRSSLEEKARNLSAEIEKLSGEVAIIEKLMEQLLRLLDQLQRASARRSAEIELAELLVRTHHTKVSHGQGGRSNLP